MLVSGRRDDERGQAPPARCLGLLPGSLSVHLDGEPQRLPVYRKAVAYGRLPAGYAAGDGAALLFQGTALSACVASRRGARVLQIRPDGAGGVHERELPVSLPAGVGAEAGAGTGPVTRPEPPGLIDAHGISELRALRAGRRRWIDRTGARA